MSGAGIYLGPHIKTGPNSYELAPIPIKTFRLPSFNGSNGLYINTGINDEGRRGNSLGKDKLSPLTPYIWDDFIGEHRANQSIIDNEYTEIFTRITSTVSNEIEQRKQYAKAGQQLTQIDATKKDQETTINTISLKEKEYQSQIDSAHSLYGQNPFYLMKELPFRKVVDGVNSVPPDLLGAYAAINRAYRSALELKRLSLENNILASHLAGLAKKLSQAETESQPEPAQMSTWLANRLHAANAEKNIRIQLLPHFLQEEIVATTGPVEGLTHSQSLERYKAAIDNIIARNQAAVGSYAVANPNIQLPLSKPELEALKNLVHLQVNTDLGKRWDDYHNSLLHSESARHLTDATNAFGELIARAKESESLLEQIRLATEAEARRVAAEQVRITAEAEAQRVAAEVAEQARVAAEKEAQRVAVEEARIKAVAEAQAQELARLAVLAETERLLTEQARASAEAAAEQTRLEAEAGARRHAEKARLKLLQQAERKAQKLRRQQARLTAQAEAQRQLEQAHLLTQWRTETEARWQSPTFANIGSTAAFGAAFTGTTGTFDTSPETSLALRAALRTAVSAVIGALASLSAPVLVGFAALLVPSRLGNGDLYSVSVPLAELAPDLTGDLYELAATGREIDLPVRLGSRTIGNRVEIVVVATDGVTIPASVPVKLAHFDARKNVYVSGSTDANAPVITWSPLVEPQNPSTEFPLIDTDLPIHEGASVTPNPGRVDPFPQLDLYGFGGFITVFPMDSGIPPTFTMFRDRRQDPGFASGSGQAVSGNWLGAAAMPEGAPIPVQIADKLRGREFSSFRAFRRAFWKSVAADPMLSSKLSRLSRIETKKGLSAKAPEAEHIGKKTKYELHHVTPISENGAVYDIDNIRLLTPKQHINTHSSKGGR